MKKLIQVFTIAAIAALFTTATTFAQSSGNFTASVDNTVCSINSMNGSLNDMFTQGSGGYLEAKIKLPNSSPGLLVTPSLVTGMYTNTATSGMSQTAAIVVVVTDAQTGYPTVTLTPNQTCVDTSPGGTSTCPNVLDPYCKCGVVYDERFQQVDSVITFIPGIVQLTLSTMSAHSFNFTRGNVPGGLHTIRLDWYFGCDDGTGQLRTAQCKNPMAFVPDSAAACAGPGTLTVTQVQQFQHSSQIGTTGP